MRKFLINSLSACGQCATQANAELVFEHFIGCIKYIWPMMQGNRAALYYEVCDDSMSLLVNEPFVTTVNNLRNRDLKRLWFLYTKNRASSPAGQTIAITYSAIGVANTSTVTGSMAHELLTDDVQWLSFGGSSFNQATGYHVQFVGLAKSISVKNAYDEASLQALLPFFEHHSKHREVAYYDEQRKEQVAAMPIRKEKIAGDLLRIGIEYGKKIYSYHQGSGQFYCFQPSEGNKTGGNKYHGYVIQENEVPANLIGALKK